MQIKQNTRNAAPLSSRLTDMASADVTVSMVAAPPKIIGIWKLGEMLYTSDHSRLFAAQPADADGSPRFDYVLRTVSGNRATREESVTQLQRFASAASAASHPNLIVVLDASIQSSSPFIVMPRLAGNTLAQWLDSMPPQPLPVILWAVRQTTQALDALHAQSWVHGDLKPSNILMSPQGHVTVLDLGFAQRSGTTNPGLFMGTPRYAAPETTDQGNAIAMPSSDICSLGKILLDLLAWITPIVRNQAMLEPVADLIAEMINESPNERPAATDVSSRLLRLEIESLGEHIQPPSKAVRWAA
jgi:eukaryotic-like serine/threonine-protein kinase